MIARGLLDETARVWLLPRFVPREPPTGAELDTLAVGAASVATGGLRAIGADATATGAAEYRAGDRHAVMTAAPDGPLTICVTPDDRSATPATCRDAETTIGTAEPTPIVVELSPLTNLPRP